ncbi:polysaccharide deacetylase family protein [Desulfotruncus alcoholivorax]|uniref:polysaccharide deacetylase family protein n=1 Tax=Desulfotruncus alcoholivorax TaxID=265477 RepID=UPI001EE5187C|nr:polysaccharide deacetylase family protein [Desulfotruncus alcoholivorax]
MLLSCLVLSAITVIVAWQYYEKSPPERMRHKSLNGIPVLMYHKVSPDRRSGGLGLRVNPEDFDWEMRYLKENGFHTVNLGDVLDYYRKGKKVPAKPVVITFDDGYEDNYKYAYPILKKYNFTATIFVVAGTIGKTNIFDTKTKAEPVNKMLDWREIKALDAAGFTIGSHTVNHPILTGVPPDVVKRELVDAKKILEKGLGKKIEYFCYPHGKYNSNIVKLVQETGYRAATTTNQGLVTSGSNPYLLNRIRVTGHYSHRKFVYRLYQVNPQLVHYIKPN